MSKLEEFFHRYKDYKNAVASLSMPNPILQRQATYLQECEAIVREIASLAPKNALSSQQFFEVCMDVCTNYPYRAIETLLTLRWHLSEGMDSQFTRSLAEKVRKAEEPQV